jgi:hypothetical protein
MSSRPLSHPDRVARTLAELPAASAARGGEFAPPGVGARDCRIDLKLLQWRALAAMAQSEKARAHLAPWPLATHPDLWAGAVQDGTARGFAVRLEEAIALALPTPTSPTPTLPPTAARPVTGKDLRKRKDLLIQSGGARVRFSRKEGLLFVDRDGGQHSRNCLWFEARTCLGTLDEFAPADERPRLFSAQFLAAQSFTEAATSRELVLAGRLGRGPVGFPITIVVRGDDAERCIQLRLLLEPRQPGWRLRARFLGLPRTAIRHECTPVDEVVANAAGGFVAFTLVRANARLRVDDGILDVPGAAMPGPLEHVFWLGADAGLDSGTERS